jgi:hypothetical protein
MAMPGLRKFCQPACAPSPVSGAFGIRRSRESNYVMRELSPHGASSQITSPSLKRIQDFHIRSKQSETWCIQSILATSWSVGIRVPTCARKCSRSCKRSARAIVGTWESALSRSQHAIVSQLSVCCRRAVAIGHLRIAMLATVEEVDGQPD